MTNNFDTNHVIATIPSARKAKYLPAIEYSKEIILIGYKNPSQKNVKMDKPICFHLMEKFTCAGISKGLMIIREEE